jgi:hypothetical protein
MGAFATDTVTVLTAHTAQASATGVPEAIRRQAAVPSMTNGTLTVTTIVIRLRDTVQEPSETAWHRPAPGGPGACGPQRTAGAKDA